jgi:hypothetical protein
VGRRRCRLDAIVGLVNDFSKVIITEAIRFRLSRSGPSSHRRGLDHFLDAHNQIEW